MRVVHEKKLNGELQAHVVFMNSSTTRWLSSPSYQTLRVGTLLAVSWLLWKGGASEMDKGRAVPESALAGPSAVRPLPRVVKPVATPLPIGLPTDVHLDKTPPRQIKSLDLIKMGWSYDCMECHKFIPAKWHYDRPMVEHANIKLEHGNNRFCLNCHHAANRNAFVDYDASEIPEAEVVLLCAKCHGPTYRDWKAGVHGRRNGHWEISKGPQTRLRCIQCHDPHQPKFQAMKPLPPLRYPPRAPHPPLQHVRKAHE